MDNNPFTVHKIDHLSASSINLWVTDPCRWCLKYLMKIDSDYGASAQRGHIIEWALEKWLANCKDGCAFGSGGGLLGFVSTCDALNDIYDFVM